MFNNPYGVEEQRFFNAEGWSDVAVSDATFDAWRNAIAGQTRELIHVVGENS
ncbi:hypothetical protein [Microbacterium lacticum]